MLATLNLQLLSLDTLDDTNLRPVSLAPGDGTELAADFSDLLRLRVDASQIAAEAGGELLPPGGSGLPLLTDLATPGNLPDLPALEPGLIKLAPASPSETGELDSLADDAELLLETPVLYPSTPGSGLNPELPILSPPLMVGSSAPAGTTPQPAGGERRADGLQGTALDPRLNTGRGTVGGWGTPVPTPVADGREARLHVPTLEAGAPTPASLGLRDRGQPGESTTRPASALVTSTLASAPAGTAQVNTTADSMRQLGLMPLQRADGRSEAGSESLQPRMTASQIAPILQTQINPQPIQPNLATAPASAAPVDLSYAAAGQQSTDLIGTSVRDAAWGDRIGDRVVMMASNQLRHAEIRLTPAELGPLRVQVSVDDGAAHVTFHAQHAVTREALEQALPRLREMLAENGLSLGQADVSDRGVGEGGREPGSDGASAQSHLDGPEDRDLDVGHEALRRPRASSSLVDTFV
ncbi:MAG: flagellar hook-length control protein FliK [Woeseiaceae bacterium]